MAHKTFEQLQTEIYTAANLIEAGAEYTHYKDVSNRYRVTGFGILEATDEVTQIFTCFKPSYRIYTSSAVLDNNC